MGKPPEGRIRPDAEIQGGTGEVYPASWCASVLKKNLIKIRKTDFRDFNMFYCVDNYLKHWGSSI
jgi:hypothetical protein